MPDWIEWSNQSLSRLTGCRVASVVLKTRKAEDWGSPGPAATRLYLLLADGRSLELISGGPILTDNHPPELSLAEIQQQWWGRYRRLADYRSLGIQVSTPPDYYTPPRAAEYRPPDSDDYRLAGNYPGFRALVGCKIERVVLYHAVEPHSAARCRLLFRLNDGSWFEFVSPRQILPLPNRRSLDAFTLNVEGREAYSLQALATADPDSWPPLSPACSVGCERWE